MKPVFHTLQRLRDQEKKEKQRALAKAEEERLEEQRQLEELENQLQRDRAYSPQTAGEVILQDRLIVTRFYEVLASESRLELKTANVSQCEQELMQARQKSRIMEEVILSMESQEALERKRKQAKVTDEIGIMAWQRMREGL